MTDFRRKLGRRKMVVVASGLTGVLLVVACGGDDDPSADGDGASATGGTGGTGASGGTGGTSATGGTGGTSSPGGRGGEGGEGVDAGADESWIVGGWLSTEEGWFGYLTLLDDLSAAGEVDLERIHQFAGDITYTSEGDGVVFVGQEGLSTVERWVVDDAGDGLEKDGEISFEFYGVTSTLGNSVIQIIDDQTGWYFDTENYQVIVFNPTTMMTDGDTIDFSGIQEQDYNLVVGHISRLDDAMVVSAQYWDADWNSISFTRAAVISIDSHAVSYADDTRCGATRFHAKDASGNLYIGAHPGESLWQAAGLGTDDAPKPCLIRILSGEAEFDPDYYVDLEEVSGGKVVGGFMQGEGNHAYVYQYMGDIVDVNEDNYNPSLRGDNWALASIELGDEAGSYTLVENYQASTAYGTSFSVMVGGEAVRYVISANSSFESGRYYDMSESTNAVEALSFPGFPGEALNH